MRNFSDIVLKQRKEAGLSQEEFATQLSKKLGTTVTRSAVSMWEAGKRTPRLASVLRGFCEEPDRSCDFVLWYLSLSREEQVAVEETAAHLFGYRA